MVLLLISFWGAEYCFGRLSEKRSKDFLENRSKESSILKIEYTILGLGLIE